MAARKKRESLHQRENEALQKRNAVRKSASKQAKGAYDRMHVMDQTEVRVRSQDPSKPPKPYRIREAARSVAGKPGDYTTRPGGMAAREKSSKGGSYDYSKNREQAARKPGAFVFGSTGYIRNTNNPEDAARLRARTFTEGRDPTLREFWSAGGDIVRDEKRNRALSKSQGIRFDRARKKKRSKKR